MLAMPTPVQGLIGIHSKSPKPIKTRDTMYSHILEGMRSNTGEFSQNQNHNNMRATSTKRYTNEYVF